jgi:glycosyltransferase involved in cell wall biosynthesis
MADFAKAGSSDGMGKKPILLYFYLSSSSFVLQDITTLKKKYNVRLFRFQPKYKIFLVYSFLLQSVFLFRYIGSASILICQFAGYLSFLPVLFSRIFKKPSVIVVGGTDCTSMPSIHYGNLRKPILRWFTLKSLKYSKHIISPSNSLIESDYTYSDLDYPKQGFYYFDPSIRTPFTVIFNGVDVSTFRPSPTSVRRKNTFLTVCTVLDNRSYKLKGIDLMLSAARHYPEFEFSILGRKVHGFDIDFPENVTLIDSVSHDLLPDIMSKFVFYCQLSMSEGFGLALAEAMACCCIPIVSRVGILEYIVGDSGFVLEKMNADLLTRVIENAVTSDLEILATKARQRIIENFDVQKREIQFLGLISNMSKMQ